MESAPKIYICLTITGLEYHGTIFLVIGYLFDNLILIGEYFSGHNSFMNIIK